MHLRLSHKIGLLVPIAIAGILSIVAIFMVEKAIEQSFREKERAIEASDKALLVLENKMVEEQGAEKDFLLEKSEEAVQRHDAFSVETREQLDVLKQSVPDAAVQQKLQAITSGLDVYLSKFKALVAANTELGLDSSKGREGEMRAAVHSIEKLLNDIKDDELRASMLTMRRHEKDFIMRRDAKYVASHEAEAKIFAAFAPARFGSEDAYESIMKALDVYQSTFKAYAATAAIESTTRQDVSKAFADIEPVLAALTEDFASLRKSAETENAEMIAKTERLAIAAVLIAILLLALTVYLVGRGISKPIVATTRAMTGLAEGDTATAIPFIQPQGRDR